MENFLFSLEFRIKENGSVKNLNQANSRKVKLFTNMRQKFMLLTKNYPNSKNVKKKRSFFS